MRQDLTNKVETHRYVIYDFESDVHTLIHKPNHVEADVLQVDKNNNTYEDCLANTFRHNGYDAVEKFCDWLFTKENENSTVVAHNRAGYDGRFILQWCLNKGLHPSTYIRQGSRIMYMTFKNQLAVCRFSAFLLGAIGKTKFDIQHRYQKRFLPASF